MSKIYIIRHGQTDLNKKQVLQGRVDEPLNADGIRQAKAAAARLHSLGVIIDEVWSSPLGRAQDTARIIAGDTAGDAVPLRIDDRLLEMDYGPYEGADLTAPTEEIIKFFSDFVNQPAPEGMEPLQDVVQRLGSLLEDLRENPPAGNVLLSTHAIAMKGALEYLTPESRGSYWSKHIQNCDIYVTTLEDGKFTVPVELAEETPNTDVKAAKTPDAKELAAGGSAPDGTVTLKTDRLLLRRHLEADAEVLYQDFGRDPKMFEYSGWNPYATQAMAEETVRRFLDNYDDPRFYGWAVENDGRMIGTIGAYDFDPDTASIEVGCSIARSSWGCGFASEALAAALDYLTQQEGIRTVKAWCAADNIGSRRIMEKAGMRLTSTEPDALEIGGHTYDKLNYELRV